MSRCPESDRAYAGKLALEDEAYVDPVALAEAQAMIVELTRRVRELRGQQAAFVPYECTCYVCGGQWDIRRFGLLGHRCGA